MRLAICIPTHEGRAVYLRELLESVLGQAEWEPEDRVEICISDNASEDGTAELVAEYQAAASIPIKYFRFPVDVRGVRNFVNVVGMAEAEYCWLVGSDDALTHGAVGRVLRALREQAPLGGMTVNKLNFDRTMSHFIGCDHDVVLPAEPRATRLIAPDDEAFAQLGMLFMYMSAHIFRREDWNEVVGRYGVEYLCTLRHFPHAFAYAEIAKKYGGWLWVADYLVIQRLDNFCLMDEKAGQSSRYASEITEDMVKVLVAVRGATGAREKRFMRKLFIVYWNPWLCLGYMSWRALTRGEARAMRRQCTRWFGGLPLFWLTSYPVLRLPRAAAGLLKAGCDVMYRVLISSGPSSPLRRWGRHLFHAGMRALGIESGGESDIGQASAVVRRFMATRRDPTLDVRAHNTAE